VPNWEDIIERISSHNPSSIQPIHPIYCKTVSNFFKLREHNKIAKNAEIILDFNIPLDDTPILMKKYKNKFLADIKKTSNVYITLGGTFSTARQYQRDLIYKLNLLYIYWSNSIPLKIKYIQPDIGYHDPCANLSKLIEFWTTGETNQKKSISERIYKDKSANEIRPERAERDAVIAQYPSSKTLFL